jgi:hypothetical protein
MHTHSHRTPGRLTRIGHSTRKMIQSFFCAFFAMPLSTIDCTEDRSQRQMISALSMTQPAFFFVAIFLSFSRGVLRYFTQTWRNNTFWCLLQRLPRPQDVGHLRLRYCNFFNPVYNLNCSARERTPLTQGYRKEPLFHTKRSSGRDRESNPGHLHGRQRH